MTKEYYVDRIGNVSVQGSVISIDLSRIVNSENGSGESSLEKKLTVTLTGQNFMNMVNMLNNTVKTISERQKNEADKKSTSEKPVEKEEP